MAEQTTQKELKPSKRKPRIVCPICLKLHCRLLNKLTTLKYTATERLLRLLAFHNPVCSICKRRGNNHFVDCQLKAPLWHHIFPDWWTTPESTTSTPTPGSAASPSPAT